MLYFRTTLVAVKSNSVLAPDWITRVMFFTLALCMGSLHTSILLCVVCYRNLCWVGLQFQQVWLLLREKKTRMLTMMSLCRLLEVSLSPWWLSPWVCGLLLVVLSCFEDNHQEWHFLWPSVLASARATLCLSVHRSTMPGHFYTYLACCLAVLCGSCTLFHAPTPCSLVSSLQRFLLKAPVRGFCCV